MELVDQSNQPIDVGVLPAPAREAAALQGQVFNPEVGFALVGNTGGTAKSIPTIRSTVDSARVSLWPGIPTYDRTHVGKVFGQDNTVIRGGYSRIYGRLNGVDLGAGAAAGHRPDSAGPVH